MRRKVTVSMLSLAFAVAGVLAAAAGAEAAFPSHDLSCRRALAKRMTKQLKIGDKAIAGCHKGRDAGSIPDTTDCNDLATSEADANGKYQRAEERLLATIDKRCASGDVSDKALDQYVSCPEPCATETGVTNPMVDFTEVGSCLACLARDLLEAQGLATQGSPSVPLASDDAKCHKAIARGYGSYVKSVLKLRTKCQNLAEASGAEGLDETDCATTDGSGKLQKALDRARKKVVAGCAPDADLVNVDSCSSISVPDLNVCLEEESNLSLDAMLSSMYGLGATICPVALAVTTNAGTAPDLTTSPTRLDAGWNGIGHEQDLVHGFTYGVGISCPNAEPPCGTCTVTGIEDVGVQSGAFSRCREDVSIECTNLFGVDGACPGLQECAFFFGPPLPLSASNTPVCVLNRVETDVTGTTEIETGTISIDAAVRAIVYTGIGLTQPCPLCTGDAVAQDGVRDGICTGGARNGLDCDVQGEDATFGATSLDCPPIGTQNISGLGLDIDLDLTTGTTSLPFGTQCDFPLAADACACAVCSLDPTLPCNSDDECIDALAGLCTSNGGGASRAPNACADLTCTDTGGGIGVCEDGPAARFCDGQKRANGKGFIFCLNNADCDAVDEVCDGGDCGTCTLVEQRSCFVDPIETNGVANPDLPILASTFCVPPTSSSGVNGATGLPGPSRAVVQLEVERKY